jgi:hypothetical protein
MSVTPTAQVVTDRGDRYRKQLARHFGNRVEVTESPAGTVLTRGFGGTTTLTVEPDALVMIAAAADAQNARPGQGRDRPASGALRREGRARRYLAVACRTASGQARMTSCDV